MGTVGLVTLSQCGIIIARSTNMVVSAGYKRKSLWIASNTPNGGAAIAGPGYIAVGGGTTAPAKTDTALGFEFCRSAITTYTQPSAYVANLSTFFLASTSAFFNTKTSGYIYEVGLFDSAGDNGSTSGGNTPSTLNDTTKAWTLNQWAGMSVYLTTISAPYSTAYDVRTILSNTATQLTISGTWTGTPPTGITYTIGGVGATQSMIARAALTSYHDPLGPANTLNVTWQITTPGT